MRQQLIDKFLEIFGEGDDANVYFAPGRINLIGEHTDYNGGHVFPCAITIGTYAAARRRKDQELHAGFPADWIFCITETFPKGWESVLLLPLKW